MQWKKYQIKIIFIMAFLWVTMPVSYGVQRTGFIGQTWSFPLFFEPKTSFASATYHFDSAYFFREQWAAGFSLNTQVGGLQLFYLELGPDFYPVNDTRIVPFLSGKFLYSIVPNGDVGWRSSMGFETHLGKSYQIENLRLRVSTGAGQIFFRSTTGESFFLDLIRLGLVWCF